MSKIREILLVHHTHTDFGFTGPYSLVAAQHVRHIREAVRLCQEDTRFVWTIEAGRTFESFLSVASEKEKETVRQLIQRGQLELTGFYTQPLTQLGDLQALYSSIEPTVEMARKLEESVEVAMIDDIGGLSYNAPQVLNYFGIRYLVNGCGGWRVMLPFTTLPHVFYLVGPDGSRVMYYHLGIRRGGPPEDAPAQYGFGIIYFLWPMLRYIGGPDLPSADGPEWTRFIGRTGIDALLARLEAEDYPFDTLMLQTATDNAGPSARLIEAIDCWNAQFGNPSVRLARCIDFFREIETRSLQSIPEIRGELTCSWSEHAVTHATATRQYRNAAQSLRGLSALEAARTHQLTELPDLWRSVMRNLLMYADHTFGLDMCFWQGRVASAGSLWNEAFNLPRQTWETKGAYSACALDALNRATDRQMLELASDDTREPSAISIFNPHSFVYDGPVRFISTQPCLRLQTDGGELLQIESQPINCEWFAHRTWVKGIEPYGIQVIRKVYHDVDSPHQFIADDWTLNGFGMRLTIDSTTGGIGSMITEGRSLDWVDQTVGHLNEIFYFNMSGIAETAIRCGLDEPVVSRRVPVCSIRRLAGRSGSHSASILIDRTLEIAGGRMMVETQYVLDREGLTIRNRVRKINTTDREACYFAFPFGMHRPFHIDVAQQGQITRFPDERLSGASNHNFAMQDFLSVSDANSTAVLVSLDAPIVSLGNPSYYHFGLEYQPIEHPTVYSYAFNNLWNTNCPLHQHGDLEFAYAIRLLHHGFSPIDAYRIGRRAAQEVKVFPGDLRNAGFAEKQTNFLECSTAGILIDSICPFEDRRWRVRLIEIERKVQQCTLRLKPGRFDQWSLEERFGDPHWKSIDRDEIGLEFRPAEATTLLLREHHG